MIHVTYFLDENQIARAKVKPPYELTGWFLEQDVQANLGWTDELRQLIAEFRTNPFREPWEGTGNAFTLTLTPELAHIESEYDENIDPCELSLDDFDELLAGWASLLRGRATPTPSA